MEYYDFKLKRSVSVLQGPSGASSIRNLNVRSGWQNLSLNDYL